MLTTHRNFASSADSSGLSSCQFLCNCSVNSFIADTRHVRWLICCIGPAAGLPLLHLKGAGCFSTLFCICHAVWAVPLVFVQISDLFYKPCSVLDLVPGFALPTLDKDQALIPCNRVDHPACGSICM